MSLTHSHIMTEKERMDYLIHRSHQQAPMQVWSPPPLTEAEQIAQDEYIKLHNLPF